MYVCLGVIILREILRPHAIKGNQSQIVVKIGRTDSIQELLQSGKRDLSIELGSILTTARTGGIYSQGAG